jgi:serine/threonine protein kinase
MSLDQINPRFIVDDCEGLVIGGQIKIGGQKRVWHCAYKQKAYVLKALTGDESTLRRVKRELEVMEVCRSPYLPKLGPIPLRQVGTPDGSQILYFLEEYVDGIVLASVHKPMPWQEVIGIGLCVSEALEILSSKGYVHRDVKPMNIICKVNGDYVLIDAGLVSVRDGDEITSTGKVVGTRPYLSPDQLKFTGKELDIRSDLFSLGITMYECATGEHPFANEEVPSGDIVHAIQNCSCPPPERFNELVPARLSKILLKALSKDRNDRYASLEMFRRELRSVS